MRVTRILAIAVIAASCGLGYVQAQAQVPAEFPPSSYTGRQYIDSKGCIFVRAGIDGSVTWVPRVTRKRKQVCGASPSGGGTTVAAAAAPKPAAKPAPEPQVIAVPKPTAPAKVAPAKPATVKVVPKATTTPTTTAMVAAAAPTTATTKVVKAPVKTVPVAKTVRAAAPALSTNTCPGASALSNRYLTNSSHAVRCGSQTRAHRTSTTADYVAVAPQQPSTSSVQVIRTAPTLAPASSYTAPTYVSPTTYSATTATYAAQATRITPTTRVAPRRVYADQIASTTGIYVPEGYQAVWSDDRLNPHRAHQTLAGKGAMDLMWTKTVPRRLVHRKTGVAVSADDMVAVQQVADVQIATRSAPATVTRARSATATYTTTTASQGSVTVSSRSTGSVVAPTSRSSGGAER